MADNTDEENLDNPIINQSEHPPDKIAPTADTETINPNQETENMEVHKHPHHVTHKKKWTEYLLEFLMIFFAVTMGFFAENIREHISDREKEHVNMKGLAENLKSDSIKIELVKTDLGRTKKLIDSMMNLIRSGKYRQQQEEIYRLAYYTRGNSLFKYSNVRFEEMNSSGDFRLIRNKEIRNNLVQYNNIVNTWIKELESRILQAEKNQTDQQSDILDDTVYPAADSIIYHKALNSNFYKPGSNTSVFIQNQQPQFLKLYNLLFERNVILDYYELGLGKLKEQNGQLLALLKKEYNLE